MKKIKSVGFTAGILAAAVMVNSAFTGFVRASDEAAAYTSHSQISENYIDNSGLVPAYADDADVALIQSDNGDNLTPEWVESLILTEVNVETASTDGKFSGMIKALDHLQEAGVNGVWLTPINDNGGTGASRYSNYGPHTIAPELTGAYNYTEGWQVLKVFVDEAHKRNIRVFLDIITWGTAKTAPLYTEHSGWYTGEEIYGGYQFDWSNQDLNNWFKEQMVSIIETTGADGFRADCGSQFSGTQLFRDVRGTLLAKGIKIAMFSECAEERDGTFDFEEHSVTNTNASGNVFWNTADFYTENNIVDAVKSGTTLGTADLLAAGEGGRGRFYSSLISCHDNEQYGSKNLVSIGYGAILAPFIPIWYIGEEWNNAVTVSDGQLLYRNNINWMTIDINREYYENVKKLIRIRRTYSGIFESSVQNHRESNICKVTTNSSIQAYARYSDGKAVIVAANNENAAQKLHIEIPYASALLDAGNYRIVDLINNSMVSAGASDALTSFDATVEAGEVGVYLVEKYADITSCIIYESGDNWEIKLAADQKIQLGDGSYWWRNLQQIASGAGEEHNAFAQLIRENIIINGLSVDDALNAATDQIASTRVWTTSDSTSDYLILTIKKSDNPYGINTASDFTLEINDGLTFNGYALLPQKLDYVALSNKFVDLGNTANIVSAEYSDGVITLTADSIVESSEDIMNVIGSKILIGGIAVTSGVTAIADKFIIEYDTTADFELQIKSGITINGKELMPARYSFTLSEGSTVYKSGEYLIPEAAEDGANITGAVLSEIESGYCNGHNTANWVISLTLDKNIYSNFSNSYYDRHLQVDSTYGAGICSKLFVNGKSLDECIGGSDSHSFAHVKANQNTLEIAVPKNNSFGFNGDDDFEIMVSDQMTMPDRVINPTVIKYSIEDGFFTIAEISEPVFTDKNVSAAGASAAYVEIQTQQSGYCSSHGDTYNPEQWLINITYSDGFATGFENYWNNHLQAYSGTSEMICSEIKLNGKTLADCIAEDSRDAYTAVHVRVTGSNSNVLQIAVPKDNGFGFDADKDFTIEVLSGITLGGTLLNPVCVEHSSAFAAASATENTPNRVKIETASNADIYIYFDKTFDISLPGNTVQNITAQTTAVNKQISHDVCRNIKINGETVKDVLARGSSLYAVQITVGNSGTQGYIRLRLDINDDKAALSLGERFTVEFADGFVLDGYAIPRKVCTTDNQISSDPTSSGGYWVTVGSVANGNLAPRRSTGDWTAYNQVLQASDPFRVQVTPADGYQLKAGSLTYSYMYKGEKKLVSLLESADGVNYNYKIADVVGQVEAQFVGKYDGINFATVGANSGNFYNKGLRFVTRLYLDNIDFETGKVTVGGTEYDIVDYGTLIVFEGTELSLDTAAKARCRPKVYRNVGGVFVDFTAELVNISDSDANTNFVACGYFSYKDADGSVTTVYSDAAVRSANGVMN